MIDELTKKDIQKISREVLKQSKSFDVFPTPVEKILNYSELAVNQELDLVNIDRGFLEKLKDKTGQGLRTLQSGLSKIKGIIFRPEKIIYVDVNQSFGRQNFVKLHEIGHALLPWQNQVALAMDNDSTLSNVFEDQFEAEANYFASITLFQQDRFMEEMNKLDLSMESAMALAKKFGSSVHSALRNYVVNSKNRCALLVLNKIPDAKGNGSICSKRDLFHSNSFINNIGRLDLPNEYGFKWDFIKQFKFKKRFFKSEISLKTEHEEYAKFNYHYFYNTYNIFIFIFPKGEVKKSSTKVILQNF